MMDIIISQLMQHIDDFQTCKSKEERYDSLELAEGCIKELKEILES